MTSSVSTALYPAGTNFPHRSRTLGSLSFTLVHPTSRAPRLPRGGGGGVVMGGGGARGGGEDTPPHATEK
ncbi:hypothetical protein, partial [Nocardia brasiliensis]|uniref:hypothetical protein n=1 Tax=Nocardia brasiliensis TaxID=37326 RepID=UPI003D7B8F29